MKYFFHCSMIFLFIPIISYATIYKVTNVRSDDVLNVRTNIGVQSPKVGELAYNAKSIETIRCRKTQTGSTWCKIRHNLNGYILTGWVNARFIVPETTTISVKSVSKKMTIVTTNGEKLRIKGFKNGMLFDKYKGKVILLGFFDINDKWTLYMKSVRHYKKLQKKYKSKLVIIAVEVDGKNDAQLRRFVKEKGINYITVSENKAGDLISYIEQRVRWTGALPLHIIFDKKGNFKLQRAGINEEKVLEYTIKKLSK